MKLTVQRLNIKNEWVSLLKGAGIAVGAALLTYVAQNIGKFDFGAYTPMVVALAGVGINYLRKVLVNADPNDNLTE